MSETKLGVSENIAGLLAYILGWISGIILLVIEKENKFVRFHAAQSVVLYLGLFILNFILGFLTAIDFIGLIFALISMLIGLVSFVLWLFLMFKAYKGEMYRLPVIADYADQLEQKF
ncbi:putative membrane protein [Methanolobus tindarius DSM 2278]|uniref:Putative membrane protein n=1 Tax=Methanolobus tindarius DSM 2278 TaxID=1090322 RepID=W9DQ64_METTI|nr:DUF4870 domain-containing protein [Methanolobus tindarius]ETA67425.1 putative membrane protein [Methanolobus tindarius DSM 2278]